jgi:hypothetical protein
MVKFGCVEKRMLEPSHPFFVWDLPIQNLALVESDLCNDLMAILMWKEACQTTISTDQRREARQDTTFIIQVECGASFKTGSFTISQSLISVYGFSKTGFHVKSRSSQAELNTTDVERTVKRLWGYLWNCSCNLFQRSSSLFCVYNQRTRKRKKKKTYKSSMHL